MPYATPQDLLQRFDQRVIGQLCSDGAADIAPEDLPTHPYLLQAIEDASGDIDVNLQAGGRYTAAQLADLPTNSAAYLERITCTIAMAYLFRRRPGVNEELARQMAEETRNQLAALAEGRNVLGLEDHRTSGTPTYGGLTSIGYEVRNLLPDRMHRAFPTQKQRLPRNRI